MGVAAFNAKSESKFSHFLTDWKVPSHSLEKSNYSFYTAYPQIFKGLKRAEESALSCGDKNADSFTCLLQPSLVIEYLAWLSLVEHLPWAQGVKH